MSSATELKIFQVILLSNVSLKYWKVATRKEQVIYNTKQMKWDHLNLYVSWSAGLPNNCFTIQLNSSSHLLLPSQRFFFFSGPVRAARVQLSTVPGKNTSPSLLIQFNYIINNPGHEIDIRLGAVVLLSQTPSSSICH